MKDNLQPSKAIGGFFELELPDNARSYHPNAVALSTGRACLNLMLKHFQIFKCYVPVYTCNALYDPFLLHSVELEYYGLNEQMEPLITPDLESGQYFLYINYFGVKSDTVSRLLDKYKERLIIDNTHSFFHRGYKTNWSFTSARKYFGVPDGAYLYSPIEITERLPRFNAASINHNVLRLLGHQTRSHKEYESYEKSLTSEINGISILSEKLLSLINYENVKSRRQENFKFLHEKVGHLNQLNISDNLRDTPFAYPLLPEAMVDKKDFYKDSFFIPNLWIDPAQRNISGFEFDKQLGLKLLPLPIDHRYDIDDMKRLVAKVEELL